MRRCFEGSALRFVGTATSGMDHIDRDYLRTRGIAFAHAPGANANSVVEYVLAAIAHCDDFLERLLAGGRVGVVGYGHIGQALAVRLQALGIDRVVYDPGWRPTPYRARPTLPAYWPAMSFPCTVN
ncbi:MAG: NAD(P)-dependent oxidoreductase [Halioglobus sp.]